MDLKITKQSESQLLSRNRVTAEIQSTGATPSYAEVTKEIASKLNVAEDLVSVRHIYTKFGNSSAKVIAHVYSSKKDKKAVERQTRKQRKADRETAAKALEEHKTKKAEEAARAAEQKQVSENKETAEVKEEAPEQKGEQ